jgi:hypothetical protein
MKIMRLACHIQSRHVPRVVRVVRVKHGVIGLKRQTIALLEQSEMVILRIRVSRPIRPMRVVRVMRPIRVSRVSRGE